MLNAALFTLVQQIQAFTQAQQETNRLLSEQNNLLKQLLQK